MVSMGKALRMGEALINNAFKWKAMPISRRTFPSSTTSSPPALFRELPSTSPLFPTMDEVAVIKTTAGEMVVEFWTDVAPQTVENFKKLARQGFYNGTAFHRIVKGFMIQGGDPLTKDAAMAGRWGTGGPGYQVKAEFNDKSHVRGVLSMARSQDPDSA